MLTLGVSSKVTCRSLWLCCCACCCCCRDLTLGRRWIMIMLVSGLMDTRTRMWDYWSLSFSLALISFLFCLSFLGCCRRRLLCFGSLLDYCLALTRSFVVEFVAGYDDGNGGLLRGTSNHHSQRTQDTRHKTKDTSFRGLSMSGGFVVLVLSSPKCVYGLVHHTM